MDHLGNARGPNQTWLITLTVTQKLLSDSEIFNPPRGLADVQRPFCFSLLYNASGCSITLLNVMRFSGRERILIVISLIWSFFLKYSCLVLRSEERRNDNCIWIRLTVIPAQFDVHNHVFDISEGQTWPSVWSLSDSKG